MADSASMYCAECGEAMQKAEQGDAFLQCCEGYGYWLDQPPLPQDTWATPLRVGRFWLYLRKYWPAGKPFFRPRLA